MKHSTRRSLGLSRRVALATVAAAGALAGVGVGAASAASSAPTSFTVEAFRETVKPWDSITIPALSCGTGYLVDQDLSPGRGVPHGVEVIEPGGVGVTISHVESSLVTDWWNRAHYPASGTTPVGGPSTATNWDPITSHELVIRLHCTTDLDQAYMDPSMSR